jgi:hypothetical protein
MGYTNVKEVKTLELNDAVGEQLVRVQLDRTPVGYLEGLWMRALRENNNPRGQRSLRGFDGDDGLSTLADRCAMAGDRKSYRLVLRNRLLIAA